MPIKVAINPPYQEHDETWKCVLTISGFGEEHERTVHGVDSIGAIQEALYLAPVALRELTPPGGRLLYRGSEDLAFPVRPSS